MTDESKTDPAAETPTDEPTPEQAPEPTEASHPETNAPPVFERTVGNLTVAVTGATGFVGRHICRTLLEHGHAVRALVRDAKKANHLP